MAQVYYAYDAANYQHYLIGESNIWQFNAYGDDYKELTYGWMPIMQFMSKVNVVSVLYVTDGVRTQLEVAYNYGEKFDKFSISDDAFLRVLKLDTMSNCIVKLKRKVGNGILQTVFVFNTLETALFAQLGQHQI